MIPMVGRVPSVQSSGGHRVLLALETKERQMWWCTDNLPASPGELILLRINKQLDKIASLAYTKEVTENSVWSSL